MQVNTPSKEIQEPMFKLSYKYNEKSLLVELKIEFWELLSNTLDAMVAAVDIDYILKFASSLEKKIVEMHWKNSANYINTIIQNKNWLWKTRDKKLGLYLFQCCGLKTPSFSWKA